MLINYEYIYYYAWQGIAQSDMLLNYEYIYYYSWQGIAQSDMLINYAYIYYLCFYLVLIIWVLTYKSLNNVILVFLS